MLVSVAIPVLNGGPVLAEVLAAVAAQRLADGMSMELVVCDSGSSDGSVGLCEDAGARVLSIPAGEFSHGGTRNRLMEFARGEFVAFLTQDAVPASDGWLMSLIGGFREAEQTGAAGVEAATAVGLVYGPYLPRADASPMVARELSVWFGSLAPDGQPRVDVLDPAERGGASGRGPVSARELYGPRAYFTDANGCVARTAWERVPFRQIAYAEDHALALDMLWAGYAKVFVPSAAVIHSHDYSPREWLGRSFDEARAIREVYGVLEPASPRAMMRRVAPLVRADIRVGGAGVAVRSLAHHGARAAGVALAGRAGRLPPAVVSRLSLERR